MTGDAPAPAPFRKPRLCQSCREAAWPAHGIGCPAFMSERPAELRDVFLWHCGRPDCAADCSARYAAQLRKLGRVDLADKLAPRPFVAAPPPVPPPRPSPPPAPTQSSLF